MLSILLAFLLAPFVLLLFRRFNLRYGYAWLFVVLVSGGAWAAVLLLFLRLPQTAPLADWQALGVDSPALLLDEISWPFALALVSLGLAAALTGPQRLENAGSFSPKDAGPLAGLMAVLGVGLLGVLAGNPLTLLLAWAAGDLVDLLVCLRQVRSPAESDRLALNFAARGLGTLLLVWAVAAARAGGGRLTFEEAPVGVTVYLWLACGLRLWAAILPRLEAERRGVMMPLGWIVPAAASLVLLARAARDGIPTPLADGLLGVALLAGLFATANAAGKEGEEGGRSDWVLGMASLAAAGAARGEPLACLAWGLAAVWGGGGLLLGSRTGGRARWILLGSGLALSGLPWMPTWAGTRWFSGDVPGWAALFVLVEGMLLAGFVERVLRSSGAAGASIPAVRWAYGLGLAVLAGTHVLAGWRLGLGELANGVWWPALAGVGTAGLAAGVRWRWPGFFAGGVGFVRRLFSWHGLFRLFGRGYRLAGSGVGFLTLLLEGEAGVLWALLLLMLLVSLLTQAGFGG